MKASVTYSCRSCGQSLERAFPTADSADCEHCGTAQELGDDALLDGKLVRCPVCRLKVLYRQKDFRQAVGCVIVAIASVLAPFTPYYSSLFAAALLDLFLYWIAGDVIICYRIACKAQIRGVPPGDSVQPFELSIHDYYRKLDREGSPEQDPQSPA